MSDDGFLNNVKVWFRLNNHTKTFLGRHKTVKYITFDEDKGYYTRDIKNIGIRSEDIKKDIYIIYLIVTTDCIFNCKYCFVKKDKRYMDYETAKKATDLLMKSPGKRKLLKFYGGEPLMNYEVIKKIVPYAEGISKENQVDLELTICTNMVLLNDEIIEFIREHNIKLALSYDGNPETHDVFRKYINGNESSGVVKEKLNKLIKNIPEENLAVNITVHRSMASELFENFVYITKLGIRTVNIEPIMANDWEEEERVTFQKQYEKILKYITQKAAEKEFYFVTQMNRKFKYNEITDSFNPGCFLWNMIQVDPDGDMFLDVFSVYQDDSDCVIGNLHKGDYTKHLVCDNEDPRICQTCRKEYLKFLHLNNNPTDLRSVCTLKHTNAIKELAKLNKDFDSYIKESKKRICF